MIDTAPTKTCSFCKIEKSEVAFYRHGLKRYQSYCKECRQTREKERRKSPDVLLQEAILKRALRAASKKKRTPVTPKDGYAQLQDALKRGPIFRSVALEFISESTLGRLIEKGLVASYVDENPRYQRGEKFQRPMCAFIEAGKNEDWPPFHRRRSKEEMAKNPKRIDTFKIERAKRQITKAVELLEKNGYRVVRP